MTKGHNSSKKIGALILAFILAFAALPAIPVFAAPVIGSSDNGDGTYNNPFIWADVPDMSMIRVGDTYWMSSTTMHMNPGVPVMKSKDLVNWETVSYAYLVHGDTNAMKLNGGNMYSNGTWASSLNHRLVDDGAGGLKDEFILIVPSPTTNNTHVFKTEDPENMPWKRYDLGARYHDCALLIDDDGRNWLTWGTVIRELNADITGWMPGSSQRTLVNTLHGPHPTTGVVPTSGLAEGLHMKKINGMYYIIAITWPSGWPRTVVAHRAPSLDTPPAQWESKVVSMQDVRYGSSGGGIAQGSLIQTKDGKWYGFAFRDSGAVGRIPWVVPITWVDGWPMFGKDGSYTNIEPNYTTPGAIPVPGASEVKSVVSSDEFYNNAEKPLYYDSNLVPLPGAQTEPPPQYAYNGSNLNLDWQWNHNMDNRYWSLTERPGWLRLTTFRTAAHILLAPNSLTQRTFGPQSSAVTAIDVSKMKDGDEAGISLFTAKYGSIGVKMEGADKFIVTTLSNSWSSGHATNAGVESARVALTGNKVYLKADGNFQNQTDRGDFYYSYDGLNWTKLGGQQTLSYSTSNHFMGYRFALYNFAKTTTGGYVDFDFYRIDDKLTGATAPTILGAEMEDVIAGPGTTNIEVPISLDPLPAGSYEDIYASFDISNGMTVTDVVFGNGVTGTKKYELKGNQLLLSVAGSSVDFKTAGGKGVFATIKLQLAPGHELLTKAVTPDYINTRGSQNVVYNVNGVSAAIEGLISKVELLAAIVSAEAELAAKSVGTFARPKTAANTDLQTAITNSRAVYNNASADDMDATVSLKALNTALVKFRQTYALDLELVQALEASAAELAAKQPGVYQKANNETNSAFSDVIASCTAISNGASSIDADMQNAMSNLASQLNRFRSAYASIDAFGALIETAKKELAAKQPGTFPTPKEEVNAALQAKIDAAENVYNNILTATALMISDAQSELSAALTVFRGSYMIAWYKFDETSGTTAYDSSGSGYHATMMNGASFTGTSASLAGSTSTGSNGQYVNLPRNILENVPGDFTISTWVKNRQASQGQFIRVFDFGPGNSENIMFLTARDFQFNMDNGGAMSAPSASRPTNNIDKWLLVTLTHEGNLTRMYVNGAQVASGTQTSTAPRVPATGNFYIGRANWADPYPNMEVKDFRIYGRALSASEVSGLYKEDEIKTALDAMTIPSTLDNGAILPEIAGAFSVAWTCSDPTMLNGNVVVAKAADCSVVLTATIEGITKTFDVTISGTGAAPTKIGTIGNPYLPLWEHLPDNEPRVFEDPDNPGKFRAYIIGSHDVRRNSYCGPDIRMWSAPVDNLSDWRDDGPIFTYRVNENSNWDTMYAPDLVEVRRFAPEVIERGRTPQDERTIVEYYLYPHSTSDNGMVCKSDRPDGPFVPINLGANGRSLSGSIVGFDPSAWIDYIDDPTSPDYNIGFRAYVYYGFQRSYADELNQDTMWSRRPGTTRIDYFMPSSSSYGNLRDPAGTVYPCLAEGEDPKNFNFFEASSMRKIGNKYVTVFSGYSGPDYGLGSTNSALRWAYGDTPLGPFKAGGVLVDSRGPVLNQNGDGMTTGQWGHNTHGSLWEINGQWYTTYHRPPRGNGNARQAVVAPIKVEWTEPSVLEGGTVTIRGYDPYAEDEIWTAKTSAGVEYKGAEVTSEGFYVYGLPPYRYYSAGYVSVAQGTGTLLDNYDIWDNHMTIENVQNGYRAGFKYFGFGGLSEAKKGLVPFEGTKAGNNTKINVWLTPKTTNAFTVNVWLDGPWDNGTWKGTQIGTINIPADSAQVTTQYSVDVSSFVDNLDGKHAIFLVVNGGSGVLCDLIGLGFSSDNHPIERPISPAVSISVDGKAIELPALPVASTNQNGIVDYKLYGATYTPDFRQTTVPVVTASAGDENVKVTIIKQAEAFNDSAVVEFDYNGVVKTYTVLIEAPKAPTISDIKIDGVSLPGFKEDRTVFTYFPRGGFTKVPVVTVDYDPEFLDVTIEQATAIPGKAVITVVTAINTVVYTLNFPEELLVPEGIQAWYKLDETSGNTAYDSSGNSYHGTVMGGALFNEDGSGINLNNSGSQTKHIVLPKNILENVRGDFTVSTMVYYRSGNTWARLFDFGPGSSSNIMFLTANTLQFNMDNANALTAPSAQNNTNNANQWRQITITRSGNTTTMYINGARATSGTQTSTASRVNTAASSNYYIGRANWDDPYPNMMVRDFRIYDRALTASEVSELYSSSKIEAALAALTVPAVLHNGDILTSSMDGFTITWTCSDPSAINDYTVVGKEVDQTVVLTAEIGGLTKTFNVTILKTDVTATPSLTAEISQDNGILTVAADVFSGSKTIGVNVFAAVYGQSGKLIAVSSKPMSVAAMSHVIVPFTFDVTEVEGDYTVKVFLWDQNYVPLAPAYKSAALVEKEVWKLAKNIEAGKSYVVVAANSNMAMANISKSIPPGDGITNDQTGLSSSPVTIGGDYIVSAVSDDMIWNFTVGTSENPGLFASQTGYFLKNMSPGSGAGTNPVLRNSTSGGATAPLRTNTAVPDGSNHWATFFFSAPDVTTGLTSACLHSYNDESNIWVFALLGNANGFVGEGGNIVDNSSLVATYQANAPIKLYEKVIELRPAN